MEKITYVTPEVEFIALSTEDICNGSLTADDKEDWDEGEETE